MQQGHRRAYHNDGICIKTEICAFNRGTHITDACSNSPTDGTWCYISGCHDSI